MDTSLKLLNNQRKIKINFNDKVYHATTSNNRLLQSTLDYNFPKAGRLIYFKNNEPMLLNAKIDSEEAYILLDPNIDEYQFEKFEETKPSSQNLLYKDMVETLKEKCLSNNNKKFSSKIKVMNKTQESTLDKAETRQEPYLKRVINVSWKHRTSLQEKFFSLGNHLAPRKKIELNGRKDYSVEELEKELHAKYFDDNNRHYLEGSLSYIGNKDGKVVMGFVGGDGQKCNFWDYCKTNRKPGNHPLHLILFTTKFSDSQKDIHSNEGLSLEIPSIIKTDLKTPRTKTDKKENNLRDDIHNLSIAQSGVKTLIKKAEDQKNCSSKDLIHKNLDNKDPLREIGNSPKDSELCVTSIKNGNFNSSTNHQNVISFTQTQSKEMTHASIPTTSKRLPVDGEFAVPKQPNKRSKAEIIQTLKLGISNVESDQVQISSKILGKGGQGVVRLGLYHGSKVAVKTMSNNSSEKNFLREVQLLSELRHDNIVGIRGVSLSDLESHIIMKFFNSVSLYDMIFKKKRDYFTLTVVAKNKITYQVACAINYLHSLPTPVIHQDIKPANVLVDRDCRVKLCDFGLGRTEWSNEELESTCINNSIRGTHFYMAPEVFINGNKSSCKSDIWSLAATLVELYSEKTVWPMDGYRSTSLCATVKLSNKESPIVTDAPEDLQKVLLQCFSYDPSSRPSIQEIWPIICNLHGCSDFDIFSSA